ncbi:MAG: serine/threonine protein kinase, partial [Planctomycetota bacterium]|nr:serine/threonine protein kinase [Planctomycetota bacterium]
DLKPGNVLLAGPERVAKIADFGLAKRIDVEARDVSQSGAIMGTASYMAPEQAAGKVHDTGPATDVYGLGALLYESLTAQPPFHAETALETLQQVLEREPLWPSRHGIRVPRDLETICLKCLNKAPARRYASAEDLANDLRRFQAGEPIRARAVGAAERTWKWARRRPAVASLLAVLAITLASSLVGFLALWRHSETERARAEHALTRVLESDKALSGAVRDLVGLLASNVEAPQMLAVERLVESSRVIRELTAKLGREQGVAASNLVAICGLERELADDFARRGKNPESLTLLLDAVELLEGRRRGTLDLDVERVYALCLMDLGRTAASHKRYDEALVWLRRAELALVNLAREPQNVQAILAIDQVRRMIARVFGRKGLEEPRRKLLELHIGMLERLSERAGADPAIGLLAAFARVDLAPDQSAIAKIRAAMERFPADRRLPEPLTDRMAVWIARDIQAYPPEPESTGKPPRPLDPEVHAREVLRTLDSRCEALGVSPDLLPAAAVQLAVSAFLRATAQRTAGRLDDARWTAASLL